jgi:hypothetical protein
MGKMKTEMIADVTKLVQCPNVEGFFHLEWKCIMGNCKACPKYDASVPEHDKQMELGEMATITFDFYKSYTKCTKHRCEICPGFKTCHPCDEEPGARMKKELTGVMKPIGVFHKEYMKPAAEDLAYHLPHVSMLGK